MTQRLSEKARDAANDLASWETFVPSDENDWCYITRAGMDAVRRLSEVVVALAANSE